MESPWIVLLFFNLTCCVRLISCSGRSDRRDLYLKRSGVASVTRAVEMQKLTRMETDCSAVYIGAEALC